ncbi:MAG TPA: restriction endonuclease [Geothrix sp.]|nr:restriction endonuclease [Geothrix sp.]
MWTNEGRRYSVGLDMPPRRKRPGKSLEMLVSSLERVLGGQANVSVESPVFLPDRVTGQPREHDVLITMRGSHHKSFIAIECRDRSRKITVNDIEGFWAKCQDTGIDQGVVVSPLGFAKTALTKAAFRNIRCLQLSEADSFPWLLATGMKSFERVVHHIEWTFIPAVDIVPAPVAFTILSAEGVPVDTKALEPFALNEFQKIQLDPNDDQTEQVSIHFPSIDLTLRDDSTGTIHTLTGAIATVHFKTNEGFVPFRLVTYTNRPSGDVITDAAIADMDVGGVRGKLMIVHKQDQGGHIVFVPKKADED